MQKVNFLGLSLVTIGLLGGCGSSSTSNTDVTTGTGFYVDSAVEGVDYVCGTQSGVTDDKGTFIFEEGKGCTFSVAGILLRTTKADELVDGEEVVEDNVEVARFLQSIDFDGNPENGIKITVETLEILITALADNSSTGRVPKDATLDAVVATVVTDVEGFEGRVKTPEEVTAHLNVGETELTKALLAGKIFYAYFEEDGTQRIAELKVDAKVESWAYKILVGGSETGTESISIVGDKLTVIHSDGSTDVSEVSKDNDKYLSVGSLKFFYNKSDAEEELAKVISAELEENSRTISVANGFGAKWIDGRTMYTIANNTIYTFSFQNNKQTIEGLVYNQSYSVEKGILTVDEEGLDNDNGGVYPSGSYQYYKILNINGTKITTTNDMDFNTINSQVYGDGNDEQVFFTNKIDAQTYLDNL